MFLSFSALLSLNAFAPQLFWDAQNTHGRFPANIENVKPEDKKEEPVLCKDESKRDLEAELKKLVEDKEAVLKELKELKNSKKEEPKKEEKKEEVKAVVKNEPAVDVLSIMSQLTSLMISQQQQQQMMMEHMFSMFAQMQKPKSYNTFSSPLAEYLNPFAFDSSSLNPQHFKAQDLFSPFEIGIPHMNNQPAPLLESQRAPAQLENPRFERFQMQPQFKTQYPMPHDGYNFSASDSNFFRVQV